jgi:hypothetical protein
VRGDADLRKRGGDLIGRGLMRRLRDLIPEYRNSMGLAHQLDDDPCRGSFAQHQR